MSSAPDRAGYRPEIDGLRALAVAAVIVHHFRRDLLPSGYLGVDVFFVISGYVITRSLAARPSGSLRELLLSFYTRRAKRIVPALVLCVVGTSLLARILVPEPRPDLTTGIAALLGLSNVALWNGASDYFGEAAEFDLFTQTWSLGVEEQFYLLYPLLVWWSGFDGGRASGRSRLRWAIAALGSISLVGFVRLSLTQPALAYYSMPTRFWELGAGGFLALLSASPAGATVDFGRLRRLAAPAALIALVAVLFAPLDRAVPATIAAVALTAAAIAWLDRPSIARTIFTLPVAIYVGRISYALYLWHWSVLVLSRWTVGVNAQTAPIQLGLMLGFAALSTHWVEEPLRRRTWSVRRGLTVAYAAAACVVAAGTLVATASASRAVFPVPDFEIEDAETAGGWSGHGTTLTAESCHAKRNPLSEKFVADCELPTTSGLTILAIGDSQMAHLIPLLGKLHVDDGVGVRYYSGAAHAFPSVAESRSGPGGVADWRRLERRAEVFFESGLAELAPGDVLLLSSRFELRWSPYSLNRSQRERITLDFYDERGEVIPKSRAFAGWLRRMGEVADKVAAHGVSVIVPTPIPLFEDELPPSLSRPGWYSRFVELPGFERDFLVTHFAALNAGLKELERTHSNFHVFDAFAAICPPDRARCVPVVDGTLLYRDAWHLSNAGSDSLYGPFTAFLHERGLLAAGRAPG